MPDSTPGLSLDEAAAKLLQTEPKEVPESDAPQSEPSEEVETTVEASEEVVEETAEAESAEAKASEDVEAPDETSTFLSDLNDWIKTEKDHYGDIKVPIKVNGEESEVALSEVIANHQIGQASEERLNTLKAEKAEFESQKQQQLEAFNNQLSQATGLVTALEQHLTKDIDSVNWEELRETDPAEYSARRQDLLERQQQINEAKTGIQKEQQQKLNENYQTRLQQERAALMESLPAWADEAVAKQEAADLREYLFAHNISSKEIDGQFDEQGNVVVPALTDHRLILMARKAMLYDKGQAKVDVAKKKVMKVPKVAKPGSKQAQPDEDVEKTKKMRSRLKKSGSLDDAAALIRNSMFGG